MILVVALLVWIAVSIPATLVLGRAIGRLTDDCKPPDPGLRVPAAELPLVRR